MSTQVDDEDDDDEDEEVPQLVRGGTRKPTQPNLRVQPPRRRKPPSCGTSSHRLHQEIDLLCFSFRFLL
ncbi:hypothetical protein Lal_00002635 [Lupinus albus]|nr:hypothetical protein Lal_00002635 [Lupinus albus]